MEANMAYVMWKDLKVHLCDRIGEEVQLQAKVVYPASMLPDTPPRILAHRCSKGMECNLQDRPACQWAGTLPGYDPFLG
jgi:hypothetical protein